MRGLFGLKSPSKQANSNNHNKNSQRVTQALRLLGVGSTARRRAQDYQGSRCPRWKKPPDGPSDGNKASATAVFAPSLTLITPRGFASVFTSPGCAELTLIGVPCNASARCTVKALSAVLLAL